MGGRWLSGLQNAVNKIRFILISYVEEIIQTSYVQWRVSFIDKPGLGGGFVDDHLEDDVVADVEDDIDIEENVVADVEDDIDFEEDVVADVEDDIDIDKDVVAEVEDDIDIEEDDLNERAEKFIADFYENLRLERQLDLERQRLVDFYENLRLQRELLDLERQRRH